MRKLCKTRENGAVRRDAFGRVPALRCRTHDVSDGAATATASSAAAATAAAGASPADPAAGSGSRRGGGRLDEGEGAI